MNIYSTLTYGELAHAMDRRNIQRIWQPNLVERVAVAYISANKDAGVALARSNPRTNDDDLLDDRI